MPRTPEAALLSVKGHPGEETPTGCPDLCQESSCSTVLVHLDVETWFSNKTSLLETQQCIIEKNRHKTSICIAFSFLNPRRERQHRFSRISQGLGACSADGNSMEGTLLNLWIEIDSESRGKIGNCRWKRLRCGTWPPLPEGGPRCQVCGRGICELPKWALREDSSKVVCLPRNRRLKNTDKGSRPVSGLLPSLLT